MRFVRMWLFWFFLKSNHWGSHIPSLCIVHAGCVFVAGIYPSRTWMSGSVETMWWNTCELRLDLGLHSHPKEFWGKGVWSHANSKGKKNPLPVKFSPERYWTLDVGLHQAGQRAQHTTNELSPSPPPQSFKIFCRPEAVTATSPTFFSMRSNGDVVIHANVLLTLLNRDKEKYFDKSCKPEL